MSRLLIAALILAQGFTAIKLIEARITITELQQQDFTDTGVGADLDGQDWQPIIKTEEK